MLTKIKLVISENDEVIETISKETSTQPVHLAKSLQEFQNTANATLTKMIESHGDTGDDMDVEDEEASDDDEEGDLAISPKKKKK